MWHRKRENELVIDRKHAVWRIAPTSIETASRKTLHFHADLLSEILSFIQSTYFFLFLYYLLFNLSFFFFFNLSRGKGESRRRDVARLPWRAREEKVERNDKNVPSKRHGLPVKIHYNDDYNARRDEIYCVDNSCDELRYASYRIKKHALSAVIAVEKREKCSKLNGRINYSVIS